MFEFARFQRFALAQAAELWRGWARFLLVCVIVHFVLILLLLSKDMGYRGLALLNQADIYLSGLFVTATIFAARHFQGMARRESAVVILMRPASAFEKWLFAVLLVLVAYPLAFSVVFQVCNAPSALYAQGAVKAALAQGLPADESYWLDAADYGVLMPWQVFVGARGFIGTALWLASLQGFALWGSLYFRAMPFISTIVAGFVLVLFLIFLGTVAGNGADTFLAWWGQPQPEAGYYRVVMPLAWLLLPGLLWLAALFALQEREVA